jgi:hypothetical protein
MAGMTSDGEGAGRTVGDEGIVNVTHEEILMRMHGVSRDVTPCGKRHEHRHRQNIRFAHDNGRLQHHEVRRRWREKIDRKGRRRDETEVRKHDERPIHINLLRGRRWRHVVIDGGERSRRIECSRE